MRISRRLAAALLVLMSTQASLGLIFPDVYRDAAWIRAAWFGNDWVTLVVASPLLAAGWHRAAAGSVRGALLLLGVMGYAVYNYAFYLFGAALNAFFPIYVVAFVLSVTALTLTLANVDVPRISRHLRPTAPVRGLGGALVVIAIGLAAVWMAMWAAYVIAGRPTPVAPELFKLVAALDLSLMVPALAAGGVLLWQRAPWGLIVAAIAGVQGALYLFVLSVNSLMLIDRGLASAPGELPIWGPLALITGGVALVLFTNVTPAGEARRSSR